jgi:hypothetical protein
LPDGVDGGSGEHGMSALQDQIFDGSLFADDGSQLHGSLNARLASEWWIDGLHTVDEIALRPVRNLQGVGWSWGLGWNHSDGISGCIVDATSCWPGSTIDWQISKIWRVRNRRIVRVGDSVGNA